MDPTIEDERRGRVEWPDPGSRRPALEARPDPDTPHHPWSAPKFSSTSSRAALFLLLLVASSLFARDDRPGNLPNKSGWQVEADPGAALEGPFDTTRAIPIDFLGGVLFPSTPSAFAAVSPSKAKQTLQVYDLRTMKPVGKPVGVALKNAMFDRMALDPDGKYIAARDTKAAKGTIDVWSVATGKVARRLEVDDDPEVKPKYVDLLGKGRLWVAKHRIEFPRFTIRTTYQVWDIGTGKEVSRFTNPLVPDGRWFTLSAGRRYQWMEQTGGWFLFLVWDLHTGKMVGEREFQGQKDPWGIAAGLAFSPDGEEMAMLWRPKDRGKAFGRLMVWETKTGKKLFDHALANHWTNMDHLGTQGGPNCIQWWPKRSGWLLFGHLLVDRDSGAVVHRVGKPPRFEGGIQQRRFLDADHLTDLEGGFARKLRVIRPPRKEIDAAVAKARGEGE